MPQFFEFSSDLPAEYVDDLESLMFFNPQQTDSRASILRSMAQYGALSVRVNGDHLSLAVGTLEGVQSLFALADTDEGCELAGVAVYTRIDIQNILMLHIAVSERFSAAGPDADAMLVLRLVDAVRVTARRLRGVRSLTILYSDNGPPLKVSVNR